MDEQQVFHRVPPRELWFGVAAGPILWAVHLVLSYGLVSLRCTWGFFRFTVLGMPGIVVILTIVTLLFAGAVVYAGLLARRNWREVEERDSGAGRTEERHTFLAYSGVLLSGLFALAVLVSLIPAFVLRPCALL